MGNIGTKILYYLQEVSTKQWVSSVDKFKKLHKPDVCQDTVAACHLSVWFFSRWGV